MGSGNTGGYNFIFFWQVDPAACSGFPAGSRRCARSSSFSFGGTMQMVKDRAGITCIQPTAYGLNCLRFDALY
jgi:hypothetical protein